MMTMKKGKPFDKIKLKYETIILESLNTCSGITDEKIDNCIHNFSFKSSSTTMVIQDHREKGVI